MIVTLNGYTINDGTNGVYLEELDGLEMPTIRTSTGNYAGRDGGYIGAQFYSARDITLTGRVFSSSTSGLEATRIAFQQALLGNAVTMTILTNAGNSYVVYCNLLDFQMPIKKGLFSADFKIELLATDPTIYGTTSGGAVTANLTPVVSGGYVYPAVYPVVYAAGSAPTSVTNNGTVIVYPKITLTGTSTNPIITNTTTQQFIGVTVVTGPSDVIVIDMAKRTVLLNGGNIFGSIISGSTWWGLLPGGNGTSLTTGVGTDTVTASISWQSGFLGI